MEFIGPTLDRAADCEAVLSSLPMWFGIEHALRMYVDDTAAMPTFAVSDGPKLVGFLTVREHFPEAWEIHCIAIRADARGQGHGSRLLAHTEAWLRKRSVRFLQVKTVAATSPSKEYAKHASSMSDENSRRSRCFLRFGTRTIRRFSTQGAESGLTNATATLSSVKNTQRDRHAYRQDRSLSLAAPR